MGPGNSPRVVFVTGATGFVGRVFVRSLLADPALEVRCLVRDPAWAGRVGIPRKSAIFGTLADADALRTGVAGAAAVVHLAGAVRALRPVDFDRVNAGGTAELVAATTAAAPGARFVHVSSLAAVGPSVDGAGTDRPPVVASPVSAYGESKRRGELLVAASELDWIGVRPPVVYGPDDEGTALLVAQARAPVTAVPRGARPLSIIHVDDVAAALRAAMDAETGRVWLPLDGPERTDTTALVHTIAGVLGRRARVVPLPLAIVRGAARLADVWSKLRGKPSFFSVDKVREIAAPGWVADPEPARRAIGFEAKIRLEDGLREAIPTPLTAVG